MSIYRLQGHQRNSNRSVKVKQPCIKQRREKQEACLAYWDAHLQQKLEKTSQDILTES